jgi:hypothetical protein
LSLSRRIRRSAMLAVLAGACLLVSACDTLMTDPAPASPELSVSFQIEGPLIGGSPQAFAKVNRLFLRFTRADETSRDTLLLVRALDGRLRAGIALETEERISALGIQAELRFGPLPLFTGGAIVPIDPGVPTTAQIQLQPVPARVVASQQTLDLFLNLTQSVQLSSAVLYATTDTIEGLAGVWSSVDPLVAAVSPAGLVLARGLGSTNLVVGFAAGLLADTVRVTVQ